MMQMLGDIGDFIGGIGVVATLIYLAVQVRQNTRQLDQATKTISASSHQGLTELMTALRSTLLSDRELSALVVEARGGLEGFDEVDAYRFGLIAGMVFRLFDNIHQQHKLGLLTESEWDNWALLLRQNLASAGFRAYWRDNAQYYTRGFQTEVAQSLEGCA